MCPTPPPLYNFDPPATEEEIRDAALQYVRKISGSTKPSKANTEAFDRAVEEITVATRSVIASLVVLGLAVPAPATTAAKGSGIKGRVVDATCYGPCVPGADPVPYSGEAEVVVRRLPRGRRVAELEVDESRYRKR